MKACYKEVIDKFLRREKKKETKEKKKDFLLIFVCNYLQMIITVC
jgi:hypothetical protein